MSLRVGVVGVGHWGRHVARDLCTLGCRVIAVARSAESIERARIVGVDRVVSTVDALPEIDAAVVCTPTTTHAATINLLLPRRIPIFTEKPLTADLDNAHALLAAAPERVFVMDKWRYHNGVRALAEIARDGRIGTIAGLQSLRMGWRERPSDVDAVFHLMTHDLSICLEVLGSLPAPRAAVAEVYEGEAMGVVATLGTSPYAVLEVSERRRQHFREVRLFGSLGTATLTDAMSREIRISRHAHGDTRTALELVPFEEEMPLFAELRAFVAYVRGEGPAPKSSLADAVAIVERLVQIRALAGLSPFHETKIEVRT